MKKKYTKNNNKNLDIIIYKWLQMVTKDLK